MVKPVGRRRLTEGMVKLTKGMVEFPEEAMELADDAVMRETTKLVESPPEPM